MGKIEAMMAASGGISDVVVENKAVVIIPKKSEGNRLKDARLTPEQRERAANQKWLIDGLIPVAHHVIIYGAAGSGKTSISLSLAATIASSDPEIEVYYFYLDGAFTMAHYFENHLEGLGLYDRVVLVANMTAEQMLTEAEKLVSESNKPEKLVFILDTLKHLNNDILSKSGNAKVLQRLRSGIAQKGATPITLHHTNKDGENYAGTAEVEQESDGLLKIETSDDPDNEGYKISTIGEGGRCRFLVKQTSFQFKSGRPDTVIMLERPIDVAEAKKEKEDSPIVKMVKDILAESPLSKGELVAAMQSHDGINLGRDKCTSLINRYAGKQWRVTISGNHNQIHTYSNL